MLTHSIALEEVAGLNCSRWKRLVGAVEELGFAVLYCSDHFILPPIPEDTDSLEVMTALTYLADHSQRLEFGPLVAPLSFHDPVLLARQAFAEVLGAMRLKYRNLIDGAPKVVIRQIQAHAEVGVEELMYNWFALDDLDGLRDLARNVLPFVERTSPVRLT